MTDHYPPVLGGIEAHVAALAHRQAARGDEVVVLTCTPADADGRHCSDVGPVRVVRASSVREGRAVDLGSFDVVHAHVSVVAPFTSPVAAAASRRAPTVVTVHSMWNGLGPVPGVAVALAGLRGAPVTWTAVSRAAARHLVAMLPRALEREVLVLPNAVDVLPRPATPLRSPDDPVQLVSTMRIARRKRPFFLLAMFDAVRRSVDLPVRLTVVGDGPLRPALERHIRRAGLDEVVTLTGRLEPAQVVEVLTGADIYLAPAPRESFGLAVLEARAVGLPVVAHADSGVTEFVRDEVEGLLCGTDAAMIAALRRLVLDSGLRREVAEHNRSVRPPLDWTSTLALHEATYRAAGAGRRSPSVPALSRVSG